MNRRHLRTLILIGIAVSAATLLFVTSQKIALKFEVVITTESDTGLSWRHVNAFTGGGIRVSRRHPRTDHQARGRPHRQT